MKKILSLVLVFVFMFTALTAFAATYETEEEAIKYIEESIKDPEIKTWINNKYGNEKLFFKAVKCTSEETIMTLADSFSDFQENGGEINFDDDEIKWIMVGLGFLLLLVIVT